MLVYAITTFNEKENIDACIKSLREANISEKFIYVIDSFSTDDTKKIVLQNGVSLIENVFNDMASQRNFAFKTIAELRPEIDFVCILDADERVNKSFHEELLDKISKLGDDTDGAIFALCRKFFFSGIWIRCSSNYPVYIDRIGNIRSTEWRNVGHGEVLMGGRRQNIMLPIEEHDQKGIEKMLARHIVYAKDEALVPISGGKGSRFKEFVLGARGTYFFIIIAVLYYFLFKGVIFRNRMEKDYSLIRIMYEIQIMLFMRHK